MFKTMLKIDGMMCSMCESHVNDAIRNAVRTKSVKSSRSGGIAVILTENEPDIERIKDAVEKTGYRVTDYFTEPYEKKKFCLFGKK